MKETTPQVIQAKMLLNHLFIHYNQAKKKLKKWATPATEKFGLRKKPVLSGTGLGKLSYPNFSKAALVAFVFFMSQAVTFGQSPGGVTNGFTFWLKPENGVTTDSNGVTNWDNQWGSGAVSGVFQNDNNHKPAYGIPENNINFHPTVSFNGNEVLIQDGIGADQLHSEQNNAVFMVMESSSDSLSGSSAVTFYSINENSSTDRLRIHNEASELINATDAVVAFPEVVGQIQIRSMFTKEIGSNTQGYFYLNGDSILSHNIGGDPTLSLLDAELGIGGIYTISSSLPWTGNYIYGNIAEVLCYKETPSLADLEKIHTYLAIKYGSHLAHDYVASDGAVIWNATAMAAYHHNVAGIGIDSASALNQLQSMSNNADAILTIGLDSIATSNASHGSIFSADRNFMIWGSNNLGLDRTAYTTDIDKRIPNVWAIKETGTVGTVEISVPTELGFTHLIVNSGDNTFTSGNTEILLSDDGSGNLIAMYDFADGDFFTLGIASCIVNSITDITFTPQDTSLCPDGSTAIESSSSQAGVKYYLRNDSDDSVVAGPVLGSGGTVSLNTGVLQATTTYNVFATEGQTSVGGLDFDGNDDNVTTSLLLPQTDNITLEAYVQYRTHVDFYQTIVGFGDHVEIISFNGTITYLANNITGTLIDPVTLTDGQWYHFALVRRAGIWEFYIDGVFHAVTQRPAPNIGSGIFHLGGRNAYQSWNGIIDEARAWTVARTPAEIANNMYNCLDGSEPGLLVYFDMEEGAGTTLTDMSGNGNHGTMHNMDPATDWVANLNVSCEYCELEMTAISTVEVGDTIAPIAICQDVTLQLNANGNATLTTAETDNGSSDNCLPISMSLDQTAFNCGDLGQTTVEITATDGSGNMSTCESIVSIEDNSVPIAICQDVTLQLDANGDGSIAIGDVDGGSNAACGIQSSVLSGQTSFTCFDIGNHTVTLTITDFNNNISSCSANVTVIDGPANACAPTAVCQDITIQLDTAGIASITPVDVDNGSSTILALDTMYVTPADFTCSNIGDCEVTLFVEDTIGGSDLCHAIVTVADTLGHCDCDVTAVCQDGTVMLDSGGNGHIETSDVDNGSSATCGHNLTMAVNPNQFECGHLNGTSTTLTVTDVQGNSATCQANVSVEAPSATAAIVADVNPLGDGISLNSTDPQKNIVAFDGHLYFAGVNATTPFGGDTELWSYNPQTGNAQMVADINPSGESLPANLAEFNGNLYFAATTGDGSPFAPSATEVWGFDGSTAFLAANINPGGSASPTGMTVFNGALYFAATDNDAASVELWTFNGSTASLVADMNTSSSFAPQDLLVHQGKLFFTATTDATGRELWSYDGTSITLVNDLNPGGGDGLPGLDGIASGTDPIGLASFNGKLYFAGTTGNPFTGSGIELWSYDPATGSMEIEADINPTGDSNPNSFAEFDGKLYFAADDGGNQANLELWSYDPVADIVELAADINTQPSTPFAPGGSSNPASMTAFNGKLYFSADDGDGTNIELWSFDGDSAMLEADISPSGASTPAGFTILNGGLYFSATDGTSGIELWGITGGGGDCCPFPVASCKDVTLQLNASGITALDVSAINDGTIAECGLDTLITTHTLFDCNDIGMNVVELQAVDANGDSASCQATITIEDHLSPTAICQDLTVQINVGGTASITPNDVNNGSSDNCGIASLVVSPNSFDCNALGANSVTLTATDVNSNVSTCQSIVTLEDNSGNCITCSPPVAMCQDLTVQLDGAGNAAITTADIDNGSTYDCGLQSWTISTAVFDCNNTGMNIVTSTIADVNGDSANCSATVIIEDNIPPVATAPADATIECDQDSSPAATGFATGTDNCDASPVITTADASADGTCPQEQVITRTWTVTDASGNSTSADQVITIIDITPPSVSAPADMTISCDEDSSPANTGTATATDNCGSGPIITTADASADGTCPQQQVITRTWTATDECGNSASVDQVITIIDFTAPIASCQDATIAISGTTATLSVAAIDNNSTDNCSAVNLILSKTTFTCSDIGTNTVTMTATDVCGNSSSCTANVIVEDNTSPAAVCRGATIHLDANGNATLTVADVDNGVSDNCGTPNRTLSQSSFACSDLGINTVSLTATDASGNNSSCTSQVTVVDSISPTAVCQDITVQLDVIGSVTISANDVNNGSSDNCSGILFSASPAAFDCNDLGGGNMVTLTVTDTAGTSANCQSTVTVEDPLNACCTGPVAICQNATIQIDGSGNGSVATGDVDGGSEYSCGLQSISISHASVTCADVGDLIATLTITDVNSDVSSCSATITVEDNIAPTLVNCPDSINNNCSAVAAWIPPTATDNCGVTVTSTHTPGSLFPPGVTAVTYTGTDDVGNVANCDFNVIVYGLPTANAGVDPLICKGDGIAVGGLPTGTGGAGLGYQYLWNPATGLSSTTAANPVANPSITTEYEVFVIDQTTGCAGTDKVMVGVIPELTAAGTNVDGQVKISSDNASSFTEDLGKSDEFGRAIASIGDLNGDGIPDIAVGAPGDDDRGGAINGGEFGAFYVLFLQQSGEVLSYQKVSASVGGLGFNILSKSDLFGWSVANIGDFDGDGIEDIAAGAPADDDGDTDKGAIYLLYMNSDGTVRSSDKISQNSGGLSVTLEKRGYFGSAITELGDLDGNGVTDLAVGAREAGPGLKKYGYIYILLMNADGTVLSDHQISEGQGGFSATIDNKDFFGFSVGSIQDLDGDGNRELLVGAPEDDDGNTDVGAVYILFLDDAGMVKSQQKISAAMPGLGGSLKKNDWFGTSISTIQNCDGFPALLIGAAHDNDLNVNQGAVWVLYIDSTGMVTGQTKISGTEGGLDVSANKFHKLDEFGMAVVSIGDVNMDSIPDLIVGTPKDDANSSSYSNNKNEGAAWVLLLGADGVSPREAVHHDLMPMDADVVPVLTQASGLESSEIVRIEGAKDRADISIFPNPTDGMVFIDLAGVRSYELRTTVLNLLGEVVYESETSSNPFHSINLSEQPAGQYFIKVKIGEETFSEIITLTK